MKSDFIVQLYTDYNEELHRYCAMQFHFSAAYMSQVDDIVQEVFIKAYRNQKELANHPNQIGWLCITCRNMCISILRRERRRQEIVGRMVPMENCDEYAQGLDDTMRWLEKQEDQEALLALKKVLTPVEVQVYESYYERGYSDRETADALGMTLVAVRGVLQRIRNKAKKHDFLTILFLTYPIIDLMRTVFFEGRL